MTMRFVERQAKLIAKSPYLTSKIKDIINAKNVVSSPPASHNQTKHVFKAPSQGTRAFMVDSDDGLSSDAQTKIKLSDAKATPDA